MRRSIVRRQNSLIIYGANLFDRDKPKIEDFNPSIDLQLSEKEFVDKYIYGIGRQRVTNRAMLKMFYRHWKRKELKENPMPGNAALFKRANELMRAGYSRVDSFVQAHKELGKKKKAARKTVQKNPVRPLKKHDPTYWAIVLHKTHLSFRSDSGYTGSQPYSALEGKTARQKASAFIKQLGIKRGQYEIIKENPVRSIKRKTRATTMAKAKAYVRRPSQASGKPATKRLAARRTKNLRVPVGVFPNPRKTAIKKSYTFVQTGHLGGWSTIAYFHDDAAGHKLAKEYAKAYAAARPTATLRVSTGLLSSPI